MRRALIIANEHYGDPRFSRLPGTVEDADGLDRVLGDPEIGAFDVTILRDANVRTVGIAISRLFRHADPDDVLLLHISAHGLRDANGALCFIASDTEFEYLWNTALSAGDVRREMHSSPARRIIVLLDCCYSGAFTRDDGRRDAASAELDEALRPLGRGAALRARGCVVITASTAVQLSYERTDTDPDGVRSGVFTRAVVRGLATGDADADGDGIVDTDELYRYVHRSVLSEAQGRQIPTLSAYNVQGAVQVARSPRGPRGRRRTATGSDPERPALDGIGPRRTRRERLVDGGRGLLGRVATPVLAALAPRPPRPPRPPSRITVSLLAVLAVLCGLGVPAGTAAGAPLCPYPTEVRVATSPVSLEPYREVADAYERWAAAGRGGCRSVHLYVYSSPAAKVVEGIRAGWPDGGGAGERYLQEVGPHPDVWLPEAGSDVAPLTDVASDVASDGAILSQDVVAVTPLVLGVPAALVSDAEQAQRTMKLSWSELFAKASRSAGPAWPGGPAASGWNVVRADPAVSTAARLATVKLYNQSDGILDPARARRDVERWIEQALDAAAYPIGDDASLLCWQRGLDAGSAGRRPAAVVLTEQAVVRFNEGRPLGGSCVAQQRPTEQNRLLAFYPVDSPAVRLPLLRLRWADTVQSRAGRAVAADFARWLTAERAGKRALLHVGLRPSGYDAGAPVSEANGALPQWPFSRVSEGEPPVETQHRVAKRYAEARRPGRVLVALDASGSMRTPMADRRRTRFQVSVAAVEGSVARMGGRDEFGLLTFSTDGSATTREGANTREVVPIGRRTPERIGMVGEAASRVMPSGDTPLYAAIRRGAALLRTGASTGDQLRALVVLTDGRDTSGEPPPSTQDIAGVRVFVIAVGDVTCADSVLDRLSAGTGGRCFAADTEGIDQVLTSLFHALWNLQEAN